MKKIPYLRLASYFIVLLLFIGCGGQATKEESTKKETSSSETKSEGTTAQTTQFKEGVDYTIFERARILDKTAFSEPQEAYSILLPTGWKQEGEVIWIQAGQACAGTYKKLKASSADNKFSLEMHPDVVFSWNSDPQVNQFNQNYSSSFCSAAEPMNAEDYFRKKFAPEELGNPEIIKIESNPAVVQQMQQMNEKTSSEMARYGSGQLRFDQTAINATVKWQGQEAFVILGITVISGDVPNPYTGTSSQIYTTSAMNRVVFKYPAGESEEAKNQFSAIMGSFRTNPAWLDAVNGYWRNVRDKKHIEHLGTIQMIDERTRQIGEQAIKSGNERLQAMDANMRSWEQQQSSQDRMHTNFIKTIREVENYRDETGKIEMVSGYNHAWSRSDGKSFILTNSPNFDPSSVFQDNQWKEMKKVNN